MELLESAPRPDSRREVRMDVVREELAADWHLFSES
jgi:hypothetical protein